MILFDSGDSSDEETKGKTRSGDRKLDLYGIHSITRQI